MYDRDQLRISNYLSGIFYNNSIFLLPIHFNGGTDKNDNIIYDYMNFTDIDNDVVHYVRCIK